MKTPALKELEELEKRAEGVSPAAVEAISNVRNMVSFDVFTDADVAYGFSNGGKEANVDIPAGTPEEEVIELLAEFVKDVRAALDAIPGPTKPPEQIPPAPNPPAPKVEKYTTGLSPEDQKYILELVDNQYKEAFDTVNLTLDSAKNEVAPDINLVKAAILKTLKPEQVAEIRDLREATLLIVPSLSPERLLETVNGPECRKMPGQVDSEIYDPYLGAVRAAAKEPTTFRFAITEGKQHFDAQPKDKDAGWNQRKNMKSMARMDAFAKYCRETKMSSLDAQAYMLLMIRGLRKSQPTDRISDSDLNCTLLPGDSIDEHVKGTLVSAGRWYSSVSQARFSGDFEDGESGIARLRATIFGPIETHRAPLELSSMSTVRRILKECEAGPVTAENEAKMERIAAYFAVKLQDVTPEMQAKAQMFTNTIYAEVRPIKRELLRRSSTSSPDELHKSWGFYKRTFEKVIPRWMHQMLNREVILDIYD